MRFLEYDGTMDCKRAGAPLESPAFPEIENASIVVSSFRRHPARRRGCFVPTPTGRTAGGEDLGQAGPERDSRGRRTRNLRQWLFLVHRGGVPTH